MSLRQECTPRTTPMVTVLGNVGQVRQGPEVIQQHPAMSNLVLSNFPWICPRFVSNLLWAISKEIISNTRYLELFTCPLNSYQPISSFIFRFRNLKSVCESSENESVYGNESKVKNEWICCCKYRIQDATICRYSMKFCIAACDIRSVFSSEIWRLTVDHIPATTRTVSL